MNFINSNPILWFFLFFFKCVWVHLRLNGSFWTKIQNPRQHPLMWYGKINFQICKSNRFFLTGRNQVKHPRGWKGFQVRGIKLESLKALFIYLFIFIFLSMKAWFSYKKKMSIMIALSIHALQARHALD